MNLLFKLKSDGIVYSRKRKEATRSILASVVSIFVALLVAILVATALGYKPWIIVEKLFSIGFQDPSYLFYKFGVYALAGFAFYFAWKSGVINIGISGQMLAAGTIVVVLTNVIESNSGVIPNWVGYGIGQIFIIVIAMIVSSSIAMLVGLMQNYLKINAVVSSILLNWIIYFISFFVLATYFTDTEQFANSSTIPDQFRLYDLNGTGAIIPVIVITIFIAIVLFVVFKYTVLGHKIKCVGLSSDASKYAGYNIKKINLLAFAISGAISGILATICYSSTIPAAIPLSIIYDSVPTEGFEGIMISLVGCNNPFGILAVSLLFGLFEASMTGLPTDPSFNDVIVGLVMLGSSLSIIVIKLRPIIRLNQYKYDIDYFSTRTNFDNSIDSLLSKYSSIHNNIKYDLKILKRQYKEHLKILAKEHENKINQILYWSNEKKIAFKNDFTKNYNDLLEIYCYKFEENYNDFSDGKIKYNDYEINMNRLINELKCKKFVLLQNYKRLMRGFNFDYHSSIHNEHERYNLEIINTKCKYSIDRFELKVLNKEKYQESLSKYLVEKANLIDLYNFNKFKNLISKKLYTKDIIEQKTAKINSSYDNTLTKYVNNLRCKDNNESKFQLMRSKAIKKSTQWKNDKVARMIAKQNRIISDKELFVKEVNKIRKHAYSQLKSQQYINEINEMINMAVKCQKGDYQ